jgi:hypothetical protein
VTGAVPAVNTRTNSCGAGYGNGRSNTQSTTENTAALRPMPIASDKTAAAVVAGWRPQHPHRIQRVAPRRIQPPPGPRVAMQLFRLFDAAEREAGRTARLVRRLTAPPELVLEEREVSADLAFEVGVGRAGADEVDQPAQEIPLH